MDTLPAYYGQDARTSFLERMRALQEEVNIKLRHLETKSDGTIQYWKYGTPVASKEDSPQENSSRPPIIAGKTPIQMAHILALARLHGRIGCVTSDDEIMDIDHRSIGFKSVKASDRELEKEALVNYMYLLTLDEDFRGLGKLGVDWEDIGYALPL